MLDDGNVEDAHVEDAHVEFCRAYALEKGHPRCIELAELLALMTKTQRKSLGQRSSPYVAH